MSNESGGENPIFDLRRGEIVFREMMLKIDSI
jgi:hypothetical protein